MIRKCKEHGYFRGEVCPDCGEEGRYVLDDDREERLGRFISGALRHFPGDVGIEMDSLGWVELGQLCDIMKKRYKWGTMERLISLVESDKKGRYEIDDGFIRARYGHSVDVDLISDYPENELPYLYYGVSQEEADMLLDNGIYPIRQCYVHLSTSFEKSKEAASVHTDNPVIMEIDANAAQQDGVDIVTVNADIVLARGIPPEYISVVESEE
ncbi:RNA 2'-phosphotransferase [Methanolobus mangrovi]|uniref:Probable RNA 2'-phosphotransferase n=1 Tax=Methanolobus mangrovi TaxID=3072977 RepID=A0AA51UEL7_9EURY|nr:RNA 2'-phosphotransferase [Methanolobus mangrovi]WMW21780.1 RNA 2'-phosphotransferase [Methanolobus mangrovi]